jgi:hypothetical protein
VRAPEQPVSFEKVLELWPTVRQSLASNYDDCPLSAWFAMRYANGWSTTPQARGTIFHRTAAEILRTMQAQEVTTIPRKEALAILLEVCHQRNVPAEDIVRVPMRQMPELRMSVDKFAKDNTFSTGRIVDIERKLEAEIAYADDNGEVRRRTITGTLDALLFDPPDGAVVIDWKDTFGLPPEPKDTEPKGYDDEELKGLSYHGYFQQRWYGYLVMRNYRNINRVTLREFYPRKTKVRKATIHRHQMEDVEQEIAAVVHALDRALAQGRPNLKPDADGYVDMDALQWWKPQPGKHCGFCNKPTACPIEEEVRVANGGAVSEQTAPMWAARMQVAKRIEKMAREGLKGLIDAGAPPVPVRWAKGRQVIGWYTIKGGGRRFGFFTPDDSDRGGHADLDAQLMEAMRESTARAKAERGVKPRKHARAPA